ncbi:MAG: hypothetical protein PUD07_02695 [bacterium]|nr:hypothetical protein [bacterium]
MMITYNVKEIYDNNMTDNQLKKIINKKLYNIINNQEIDYKLDVIDKDE